MSAGLFGETGRTTGIGGHQSAGRGHRVWLTPPDLLAKLGEFDLDPCAAPPPRPWPTAKHMVSPPDDGLSEPWHGRVWCNPPYDLMAWTWLERLADHGNGLALVFARTETEGFHRAVWRRASALLFLAGRLHFHDRYGRRADANAGGPSVLIAYGKHEADRLAAVAVPGAFIRLNRSQS